jgi:hypothetical protein
VQPFHLDQWPIENIFAQGKEGTSVILHAEGAG